MRDFQDNTGGKFDHPGLTSNDIFDLVQLSSAAYDASFSSDAYELSGLWTPITAELGGYGLDTSTFLKNGYYYESESYSSFIDLPRAIYPGTAQAAVFSNGDGDITLSFRGTAEFGFPLVAGDSGDWGPIGQLAHFAAFSDLFEALDSYLVAHDDIERVFVTGHSLGGAMVERYMESHSDGYILGIEYEAVAFASPEASFESDSRVLNIGHNGDLVYSIAGLRGANAVDNIYMLFDDGGFSDLGIRESWGAQHDISDGYIHTVGTLLASQFYALTDRNSQVVISYTDQVEELRELVNDFWTPDDSQLILGRGADPSSDTIPNIKSGGTLSIDDWLIGGDGDDWLEGFRGDDVLEGDINDGPFAGGNDTMAGGEGRDIFLGTPEDLDGDTIVDLEVGDFIQLKGVNTADIIDEDNFTYYGIGSNITLSFDEGALDFFGTTVNINMTIPTGATLKLVEDSEEAKIEVVGRGQDIAFVVDTTGSMWDDIANVKSSAIEIINSIFDPERGLTDSRIAVVGFNDPTTETVLSFTNHADPEDRKTSALNAINSLSANGGGDFPELTYTGLLRALDGSAGEWREDAVARKIILFGDATAKDTHLRDQVIALANNLSVAIDASASAPALSTVDVTEDISLTSFKLSAKSEDGSSVTIPVQIFTVAIGSNSSTLAEYESISEATGGDDFTSAGASGIVEALLEIINLPIYSVFASTTTITEGDSGLATIEITVQRDSGTNAADATLVLSGTSDDVDRTLETSTVSFAEGELSKTIQLNILGDTTLEENETITVTIDNVSETSTIGAPSTTVTILNDDASDGDDVINGDNSSNVLDGGAGNDQAFGNGGDDNISGGTGNDILGGGTGNDEIIDGLGNNTLDGGSGLDRLITFSGLNTISGGADSDFLAGGFQSDIINGNAGNDVIRGEAGTGFLAGSDQITGGTGDDIMMGGRGADTFIFNTNDGNDIIAAFNTADVAFDATTGYSVAPSGADFQSGIDHIQLAGFTSVDASNVMASVTDGADGAVFSAEGTSITFYGVDMAGITADDFIFA